jgi:phospholipid/cholesterol/gamma-HCH transport system substrate-binding protein
MKRFVTASVLAALVASGAVACVPSGGHTLAAEFADVGDLVSRANVQQSDAVIGTVTGIKLEERGDRWLARVEMRLQKDAPVMDGTMAVVRSTSLLGEKFVDLVPPKESGPQLANDAVIPVLRTARAPELEEVFKQLGAILQSGALNSLAALTSAGAMILEGQEDDVGRVLDGTAKLVSSIHAQRNALATALADLSSSAKTLNAGSETIARSLDVSKDALGLLASQRDQVAELVTQLDRLAKPLGELTKTHSQDIDAQVKAINKVVPKLYEVRHTLRDAVIKLPKFAKLFARAAPGDYVQLDILVQTPVPLPVSQTDFSAIFKEALT